MVPRQERGFEILPAAYIAIDEINRLPNLLPNHRLELIDVVTEKGCNSELTLTEIVKHLSDEGKMIVGIIGLFCNEITRTVSDEKLTKRLRDDRQPFRGLLQLSGATSPILRDREKYPYLYRMLPSSAVYTEAVIRLFDQLGWSTIGILYATIDDNFYFRTAKTFDQSLSTRSEKIRVPFYGEVTPREFPDFPILLSLHRSGTKITVLLLPITKASDLLCSAYTQGYRWPDYAWLLIETDPHDQFTSQGCNDEIMQKAIEGLFLLRFHFQLDHHNPQLISGIAYDEYLQKLHEASGTYNSNPYAHVLYDSVWAFAVALNNSEDLISRDSGSDIQHVRNIVQQELPNVSFTGALGNVSFDLDQEVKLSVDILQIKNGTSTLIGNYDPVQKHLIFDKESIGPIPSDELERIYQNFPIWLTVILSAAVVICILFTTGMLVLFICYRNQPEIKASSWFLSLFMFFGCYLVYICTLIHTVASGLVIDGTGRKAICSIVTGMYSVAIDIIFASIFTKMLRIYRVFTYFGKTGKLWSDTALTTFIIFIVLGKVMVFVIWAVVDLLYLEDRETYHLNTIPPHYEVVQHCSSQHQGIWLTIAYGYSGTMFISLLLLAFKTRKIRRENFKDTKKVNALFVTLTVDICLVAPLWWVLQIVGDPTESKVVLAIGYGLAATACQFYLIVPKTIPPFCRHLRSKLKWN